MGYKKMTENEMTGIGVSSAGNILTGSAEQNKRVFDNLPIAIGKNVNEVIDALEGVDAKATSHTASKANPHSVTKAQVGLGNVDNTADLDKPVSVATSAALAEKADKTELAQKVDRAELAVALTEKADVSALAKINKRFDIEDDGTEKIFTAESEELIQGRMMWDNAEGECLFYAVRDDDIILPEGAEIILEGVVDSYLLEDIPVAFRYGNNNVAVAYRINLQTQISPPVLPDADIESGTVRIIRSDFKWKSTSDVLEGKADKTDTYTKAEVDKAIANVTVSIDNTLDTESENPVQNKAVAEAIAKKADASDVYTRDEVNEKIAGIDISASGGADADLSNYLSKDNTEAYTPSSDYNPATKKYVDDAIQTAIGDVLGGAS